MTGVRYPAVAGAFYPAHGNELAAQVDLAESRRCAQVEFRDRFIPLEQLDPPLECLLGHFEALVTAPGGGDRPLRGGLLQALQDVGNLVGARRQPGAGQHPCPVLPDDRSLRRGIAEDNAVYGGGRYRQAGRTDPEPPPP